MRLLFPLLTLLAISFPIHSSIAQDATDDAADSAYDDGWQNFENPGSNFSGWFLTLSAVGGGDVAETLVQDATIVGGDASMNAGGRALHLHSNAGSFSAATDGSRPFTALAAGGKMQFRMQHIGTFSSVAGRGFVLQNTSATALAIQQGTANWELDDGNATVVDTGIARANPIEVLITHNSTSDFDIRITELVAPNTVYSANNLPYVSTGSPDEYYFYTSASTGEETYLIINDLIVNPDGTLPVEISSLELE